MIDICVMLLWIAAAAWGLFLLQAALNAVFVPVLSRVPAPAPARWPRVSYVVPARNEERGIRAAVTSFCTQDYPDLQVVVINDRSTDTTGDILAELQQQFDNLTVVEGVDPPEGWLGKPNALERGRAVADGAWILMADADSLHAPDTLRRAMADVLQHGAGMMVVRPRHVSESFLEAVLMSGVNFFFFIATPAFFVPLTRSSLFAAGSPVFNLMRRDALEAVGGFACLKQAVVDDLEIGFRIKQAGWRQRVTFAGSLINHRMYGGAWETVKGFAKTTYPTIRKAPYLLPVYIVIGLLLSVFPYAAAGLACLGGGAFAGWWVPSLIALGLMHVVLAFMAFRYGEPWYVALTNPLREIGWLYIFTRSFILYYRKGLQWRGRTYPASASSSSS